MDDFIRLIVNEVISPILVAALAAVAGWVLTKLPGPLRTALTNSAVLSGSAVRMNDVALVVAAMKRRADAQVSPEMQTGTGTADILDYAGEGVGDVMDKLHMSDRIRETMAAAAIKLAAPAPVAVVVPVLDPPR